MKYLSWLLLSKEKGFFVFFFLAASVWKAFYSFWLRDARHFHSKQEAPSWQFVLSVRISWWIYYSVPPLAAPQLECGLGWPWRCSFFCSEAKAGSPVMVRSVERQLSCMDTVTCDRRTLAWESTRALVTGGSPSVILSVSLLTNGSLKDTYFWKHGYLHLSLFVVRHNLDHTYRCFVRKCPQTHSVVFFLETWGRVFLGKIHTCCHQKVRAGISAP